MRLVVLRVLAACCALSWLAFPGFGVPDLAVTWDPRWAVVLEAGWGLFSTVLVAGPFLSLAVRPRRPGPALAQLWVCVGALAVAVPAASEPPLLVLAALLAVEAGLVSALTRGARPGEARTIDRSPAFLALATVGVVGWTAYAVPMFRADRTEPSVDVSVGVEHYAVQGAFALAVAALVTLAAVWAPARRQPALSAGVAGGYLALVSLASPAADAAVGRGWSLAGLAWGVAVVLAALVTTMRPTARRAPRPADGAAELAPTAGPPPR